jgi:selenocysteine lyase/cysteine desulfurase
MEQRAYIFSGGIAPHSTLSLAALDRFNGLLTNDPGELYRRYREEFDVVRKLFADLIGADVDEVAVTDCTGTGSNLAVELIDPVPGSNVVFDESAYPSAAYPWMLPPRSHVELRFVPGRDGVIHLEDMAEAIDDNTIAVSVSHVSQESGFRHDLHQLAELAHARGAALCVDAMQSAGALDFDVHEQGIDYMATGAMKWLLGSAGVGFFYAHRSHLEKMPPHAGGPGAKPDSRPWGERQFVPMPGADRLHVGMPNLIGLAATRPGLEILHDVGMDVVEAHVLDLSGYCISQLLERDLNVITPLAEQFRAGIVSIGMQNDEDARMADEFLTERGVDGYHHQNVLRVDPHVFNNRDDIDRFLRELDSYLSQH